jgi:hypothetical protein
MYSIVQHIVKSSVRTVYYSTTLLQYTTTHAYIHNILQIIYPSLSKLSNNILYHYLLNSTLFYSAIVVNFFHIFHNHVPSFCPVNQRDDVPQRQWGRTRHSTRRCDNILQASSPPLSQDENVAPSFEFHNAGGCIATGKNPFF